MRFFLVSLLLFVYTIAYAQNKVSLSGHIRDAKSSEDLLGATVYVKELGIGISANNYGFYSIAVPKGTYTLIFSYVGYNPLIKEFNLNFFTISSIISILFICLGMIRVSKFGYLIFKDICAFIQNSSSVL